MAENNDIIERLQNQLYDERQQHARTQVNFKRYKETHYHYAAVIVLVLVAVIGTLIIFMGATSSKYGPIISIQGKKVLISCPDKSTQWAPMPQCKEIK